CWAQSGTAEKLANPRPPPRRWRVNLSGAAARLFPREQRAGSRGGISLIRRWNGRRRSHPEFRMEAGVVVPVWGTRLPHLGHSRQRGCSTEGISQTGSDGTRAQTPPHSDHRHEKRGALGTAWRTPGQRHHEFTKLVVERSDEPYLCSGHATRRRNWV